MKKLLISILTFAMLASLVPASASAATTKTYLSNKVNTQADVILTESSAPDFIISSDKSFTENFSFGLVLDGAKWGDMYTETGELETGIAYERTSNNRLRFDVDVKKFDATNKDITIPLSSVLTKEGDISVALEKRNSNLTETSFVYAHTNGRTFSLKINTIKNIESTDTVGDIVISDDFMSPITNGTVYTLKLDNGFTFKPAYNLALSGKYSGIVDFSINPKDASTAYLTMKQTTSVGAGTIIISDLQIGPSRESTYVPVEITLWRGSEYIPATIAQYVAPSSYSTPIMIFEFEAGVKPTASGTSGSGKTMRVMIDDDEYGDITADSFGNWTYEFPYEFSRLKPGVHTFWIGYYQASTEKWFNETSRKFEIAKEKSTSTISFRMNNNEYTYDGRKGYLTTPPFTDENSRALLPIRGFSNVLGITSDKISWNDKTKTATITLADRAIRCTVGVKALTIYKEGLVEPITMQLDTSPVIKNDTIFLPLRPLLNAFGIKDSDILWDKKTNTVTFEA